MEAFNGDQLIKEKYLKKAISVSKNRTKQKLNPFGVKKEISFYELQKQLNIPAFLIEWAYVLFDGMGEEKSIKAPVEFLKSINPGSSLEYLTTDFALFLLENNYKKISKIAIDKRFKSIINPELKKTKLAVKKSINFVKSKRRNVHDFICIKKELFDSKQKLQELLSKCQLSTDPEEIILSYAIRALKEACSIDDIKSALVCSAYCDGFIYAKKQKFEVGRMLIPGLISAATNLKIKLSYAKTAEKFYKKLLFMMKDCK